MPLPSITIEAVHPDPNNRTAINFTARVAPAPKDGDPDGLVFRHVRNGAHVDAFFTKEKAIHLRDFITATYTEE